MSEPAAANITRAAWHRCITCGDEATSMVVVRVDAARALALCADAAGRSSNVETALVEPVSPGELLLVHAGTAISRAAEDGPPDGRAVPRRSYEVAR